MVAENWEKNAEFRLYGRADLFEEFDQPSPEPAQDLRTRIRLYFRLATAAILVPVGVCVWLAENQDHPEARGDSDRFAPGPGKS